MTRMSPTLYPDRTDGKKVATHQERFRSEYAQPNVTEFCSVVNEGPGRASEGANLSSSQGWHPQADQQFYPVSVRHTVANKGGSHVPVSGAGCTVNEGYYSSETRRLCGGIESPRHGPINRTGHTIPEAFERLNAPQMRRDALPPVWLMIVSALTCLFALLVADALYSKFFEWMVLQ